MKRIIVDMSSIMWTCLLAGVDKEFGRIVQFQDKPFQVNSAIYGYDNAINHISAMLRDLDMTPMQLICVVEGKESKLLRTQIMPTYKGGNVESRPQAAYDEFQALRSRLTNTLKNLGATIVSQDYIEADDIIAYLALNLQGVRIIDSNDGDMGVLITDDRPKDADDAIWLYKFGKGLVQENPIGPFPCKHITLYKALVGDTSDKVSGCSGFGKTAWMNLMVAFGYDGLDALADLFRTKRLDRLSEDVADFKPLQKIIDQQAEVYKCYNVVRLYPEKVNTQRRELEWTVGMTRTPREVEDLKDERLKAWVGQRRIVYKENYDSALPWMISKYDESPFISFDIETSSCDEGDAWMAIAASKGSDETDGTSVDVFGAKLTSFSVTFGNNMQYTLFFTVDHVEQPGKSNISLEQAKAVVRSFPKDKINAIQHVAFELPVIMENLGSLDTPELPVEEEGN